MKKTFYALLLALLIVPVLVQNAQGAFSLGGGGFSFFSDTPGNGFEDGDPCGYVIGQADPWPALAATYARVDFDSVTNTDQGCVDENGYFYSSSSRESYALYTRTGYSTTYMLDFDYSTTSNVWVDPSSGEWSGAARITNGSIISSKRWIDFDWDCSDSCMIGGTTIDPADYHVYTDMSTGEISGYAWSDYFNDFISFNGLTMELPAQQIETYVDILANETTYGPDDVDYSNAPLADGAEYWRVRVQFWDSTTSRFLTADEVSDVYIDPFETSDSQVYFNQVENTGNAIEWDYYNGYLDECSDPYIDSACVMTETDGSTSFNLFIYGGAPTSNVLGLNDDTDIAIEYYSDREGCRWIYSDQTGTPTAACSGYTKADVFEDRQTDRNKFEVDYVEVSFSLSGGRELDMATVAGSFEQVDADTWAYYFDAGTADLSYRPRYQITQFYAVYDGDNNTTISTDTSKDMRLKTVATVSDTSAAFQARSSTARPTYYVNYQMDVTGVSAAYDQRLLIDSTGTPTTVETTTRRDTVLSSNPSYSSYSKNYKIAYGQTAAYLASCGGVAAPCVTPTNTISDPTAEQWVCDDATEYTMGETSCYYTEYLPHTDRHANPESMLVIGAINSVIDADDVLETVSEDEGTVLSVLGTTETITLRNKMYAQVARYTLGQTASSGSFDASGTASSGIKSLMNGRLFYAQGDVVIDGFDGSDKTLVVIGGDVYVNTDITNGRMGIIAFERDGAGGNVYVKNTVTDLWVNFFLDGTLFSYDGTAPSTEYPAWASDEDRLEGLMNQLYLKGSLVSRNTVNGSAALNADGYYEIGDGSVGTTDFDVAREYDLNLLRQYRLCYQLVSGELVEPLEECNEGESLSDYGETNGYYNSFILEYEPADQLPIFQVESGLFN